MSPAPSSLATPGFAMVYYAPRTIPEDPQERLHMTRFRPKPNQMRPRRSATRTAPLTALCGIVACVCVVGCRSQDANSTKAAPSPSPQQATEIRQELLRDDPNVIVGDVVEVLPEANLAAVG